MKSIEKCVGNLKIKAHAQARGSPSNKNIDPLSVVSGLSLIFVKKLKFSIVYVP